MFGISKLDEAIGNIPPGSNILLIGPPMTGKSILVRDFFYTGLKNGEGGIYISTKDTAAKLYQSFKESGRDLKPYEDLFGIIDCVSGTLPIKGRESFKNVTYAASAIDMPTISTGLNEFLKKLIKEKKIEKIRVVVESLSNLLMYSNLQTVYRFLHVFTSSTRAVDAISIYSVEEGMHTPETIATLKQLVQMAIEIQEDGDKRMVRVVEGKGDHKWLEKYAKELEQSNELKDLFTDIMRHDLLNPVGIIRNLAEIMAEDERFKDIKDLNMIWSNARKLEEMIVAASSYAMLESAEDIRWREMDLNELIKDAADSLKPYFEGKRIKLELLPKGKYVANTVPIVEEVFVNLLSNAVKYSPENTKVTVNIEDAGKNWRVTVADQGAGVPDEYKESIFNRFTRRKKEGVRGTGIGLAIVKRIADLHKGAAGVLDNLQGGSIFYFEIPKSKER